MTATKVIRVQVLIFSHLTDPVFQHSTKSFRESLGTCILGIFMQLSCIVILHFDVTLLTPVMCVCVCVHVCLWVTVNICLLDSKWRVCVCYAGSVWTPVKCQPQTERTDSTRLISLLADTHSGMHMLTHSAKACSYDYISHTLMVGCASSPFPRSSYYHFINTIIVGNQTT